MTISVLQSPKQSPPKWRTSVEMNPLTENNGRDHPDSIHVFCMGIEPMNTHHVIRHYTRRLRHSTN